MSCLLLISVNLKHRSWWRISTLVHPQSILTRRANWILLFSYLYHWIVLISVSLSTGRWLYFLVWLAWDYRGVRNFVKRYFFALLPHFLLFLVVLHPYLSDITWRFSDQAVFYFFCIVSDTVSGVLDREIQDPVFNDCLILFTHFCLKERVHVYSLLQITRGLALLHKWNINLVVQEWVWVVGWDVGWVQVRVFYLRLIHRWSLLNRLTSENKLIYLR